MAALPPFAPKRPGNWCQAAFLAWRRRLKTPAAAAPNSSIIGGAGTSVPPVEVLVLEPPELVDDEVLVEVEELVELDEETLPDDELEVDE